MGKYTIEMAYKAIINICVEANNEAEAVEKARDLAEKAYMEEFYLTEELDNRIVSSLED
jgi:hypothetical protein